MRTPAPPRRRRGAAMLMVMIVLLMTTAAASLAIHSTTAEIRAAGHFREAAQTQDIAEGSVLATIEYIDAISAQAFYQQLQRSSAAGTTRLAPEEVDLGRSRLVFRVRDSDFAQSFGAHSPPVETDVTRTPSLGPYAAIDPGFDADFTDSRDCFRDDPGRRADGANSMRYLCGVLTGRARLGPPMDVTQDYRPFHGTAVNARALVEVGPFGRQ